MKVSKTICDCCGQETDNPIVLRLPIIVYDDSLCLTPHDMDICENCANAISREYYRIAREHSRTGIHAARVEDGA